MRSLLILLTICLTAGSFAQHSCCEPPAFSFDDLPRAIPLENRGNGKFKVASEIDSVQYYVDQGYNLYHNFNYFEAYVSFDRAASLDTLCMGALLGKFLIFEATEETDNPHYIEVGNAMDAIFEGEYPMSKLESYLYLPEVESYSVKKKYLDTFVDNCFERLLINNPDDPEAYVWFLRNLGATERADSFALRSIEKFPNYSPLMHYVIHLWEERNPSWVKQFKNRISALAPESGHLTHMPGHIYHFNGYYELADSSFKSSYIIDSMYNATYPKRAPYNWNFVHNLHFIYTNLIEMGKLKEAEGWMKKMIKAYDQLDPIMYDSPEITRFDAEVYGPWRRSEFKEAHELALEFGELETDYFLDAYYVEGLAIYFEALNHFKNDFEDSLMITYKKYQQHYKNFIKSGKKNGWKKWMIQGGKTHNQLYVFKRQLKFLTLDNDEDWAMSSIVQEVEELIEEHYTNDPSTHALLWEELAAMKFEKMRDYDNAQQLLNSALKKKPMSGIIHLNRARLFLKTGQKAESRMELERFYKAYEGADKGLLEFEKARVIGLDLEK